MKKTKRFLAFIMMLAILLGLYIPVSMMPVSAALAINTPGPYYADSIIILNWNAGDLGTMSGTASNWRIQVRLMDNTTVVADYVEVARGSGTTSALYNIPNTIQPGDYTLQIRGYRNATNLTQPVSIPITISPGTVSRPNLFPAGDFETFAGYEWVGAPRAEGDAGSPDMNGILVANDNTNLDKDYMVELEGSGNIMRHPISLVGNARYRLTVWAKGGTDNTMTGVTLGPSLGSTYESCRKNTGTLCHDFWCGCDSQRQVLIYTAAGDGGGWTKKTIDFTLDADLDGEIMIRAWPPNWNSSEPGWPGPESTLYISQITIQLLTMSGDIYPVDYGVDGETGGTLSGTVGLAEFKSGSSVAKNRRVYFTATPEPGYTIDKWIVDGNVVNGTNTKYTTIITEAADIRVKFKAADIVTVSYAVNGGTGGALTAEANGSAFASGAQVSEGLSLVFRAAPANGYEVKYWILNGERKLTTTKLYTVASLKGNFDIKVVYGIIDPTGGRASGQNGTNKNRLGINLDNPVISCLTGGLNAVFPDDYLESINPYGVLRTMALTKTNSHVALGTENWSNRVLPDGDQTTDQGIAWEYIIALANTTNKDIWISVPVRANDDYIEQLATMMRDNLNPNITVYVEWGNEVWGFAEQVSVNRAMAQEKGITGGNLWNWTPSEVGDSEGAYGWGELPLIRHFAQRTADIAQIFRDVFDEDGSPISEESRVKPIMTWQVMPDFVTPMMHWLNNHANAKYHNANEYIYAAGVAPYFREPSPQSCDEATAAAAGYESPIEYIHAVMRQSIEEGGRSITADGQVIGTGISNVHSLVAATSSAQLIGGLTAYEGGPHHQGQTNTNLAWRTAAQKDPVMTELLQYYIMDNWYDLGANLFMYFAHIGPSSQYGYWGNLDNLSLNQFITAPKFAALKLISQVQYEECATCGGLPCECEGDEIPVTVTKKPYAVQDFDATTIAGEVDEGTITFTWTNPNNADSAAESYELYLTNGGNKWIDIPVIIDAVNTTVNEGITSATFTFEELGITKSGDYDFRIKAANALGAASFVYLGGESRYKLSVVVEILDPIVKPKVITNFEAVLNGEEITFSWVNPNPEKSASTVDYYSLFMTSGGNAWLEEAVIIESASTTVSEGITSVTLSFDTLGIIKSGNYDFRIKASNGIGAASYVYIGGESRYKVVVEIESLVPIAKPKAVTNFNATLDGETVTFTWINPNNSATAVGYYELYRTNTGNTWQLPVTIDASEVVVEEGITYVTFTLEDLGIDKDGTYDFRIKGINDEGVSALAYLGGGTSSDPGRYRLDVEINAVIEGPTGEVADEE